MQRVFGSAIPGAQRACIAAISITAFIASLGPTEIGQNLRVAPSASTEGLPRIEILRIATNVDEAVDGRRSTEDLAARGMHASTTQTGLRLGAVVPVESFHIHRDRQGRWHLDEDRPIGATELQQENAMATIRRQSVGQNTAGRSRAADDVIELLLTHGSILSTAHRHRPSRRRRS